MAHWLDSIIEAQRAAQGPRVAAMIASAAKASETLGDDACESVPPAPSFTDAEKRVLVELLRHTPGGMREQDFAATLERAAVDSRPLYALVGRGFVEHAKPFPKANSKSYQLTARGLTAARECAEDSK